MGFDRALPGTTRRAEDAEGRVAGGVPPDRRPDDAAVLLRAARREGYRSMSTDGRRARWFAMLVRRRADREPVPGKRTAIQAVLEGRRRRADEELAPGRRTLTGRRGPAPR